MTRHPLRPQETQQTVRLEAPDMPDHGCIGRVELGELHAAAPEDLVTVWFANGGCTQAYAKELEVITPVDATVAITDKRGTPLRSASKPAGSEGRTARP